MPLSAAFMPVTCEHCHVSYANDVAGVWDSFLHDYGTAVPLLGHIEHTISFVLHCGRAVSFGL